ncbi:SDR family oxidoreductase [Marinobacter szutsaonensis]
MTTLFESCASSLQAKPKAWLITGVAGFIGSNLLEWLLVHGQKVVGLDNFSTGSRDNLAQVRACVGEEAWRNFFFIEGSIEDFATCVDAVRGVDHVLHHAAVDSVPRCSEDLRKHHETNVNGFLNMLMAARDEAVSSFTYASCGSVSHQPGPESTAALRNSYHGAARVITKQMNEFYASVFAQNYQFKPIGLRYFEVFGPRQNPEAPNATVIPRWLATMLSGQRVVINGDGRASLEFCYVADVVQANILAAVAPEEAKGEVYSVVAGNPITLNELFNYMSFELSSVSQKHKHSPLYNRSASEEIRYSREDLMKIGNCLGYQPRHDIRAGLSVAVPWYMNQSC